MSWEWKWLDQGPTPASQNTDSEMFDRADYPYSETFVREAIQNSLDARLDVSRPVRMVFNIHESRLGKQRKILAKAVEFRRTAELPVPPDWDADRFKWLTVQDFNTTGLLGDIEDRGSDFWNYWLNFGISNKSANQRGGRGIGRVTFLIASRISSVIALTRRSEDKLTAGCGMCVLRAGKYGGSFKTTHAYLAEDEKAETYELHSGDDFHADLLAAFGFEEYLEETEPSGLALAIPYPHEELDEDTILASAIENFAPAILSGNLVIEVGPDILEKENLYEMADMLKASFRLDSFRQGAKRAIGLIRKGQEEEDADFSIKLSGPRIDVSEIGKLAVAEKLRGKFDEGQSVLLSLIFPLRKNGKSRNVSLRAVICPAPYGKAAIDRFYREGMCLPDVRAARAGEADTVFLVEDEDLATCLNLCEGKAHLDLLEIEGGTRETAKGRIRRRTCDKTTHEKTPGGNAGTRGAGQRGAGRFGIRQHAIPSGGGGQTCTCTQSRR